MGNVDKDTKVVNWFKVRFFARYIRVKPNSWNGDICIRTEIIGCNTGNELVKLFFWMEGKKHVLLVAPSILKNKMFGLLSILYYSSSFCCTFFYIFADSMYEIGAENRVLESSRFSASGFTAWFGNRYRAHDGRLNNDRPWGITKPSNPWFKVDLGRTMLINGISTQGDGTWGPNYYPDFKIQYSFDVVAASGNLTTIKEDLNSSEKVRKVFSAIKVSDFCDPTQFLYFKVDFISV